MGPFERRTIPLADRTRPLGRFEEAVQSLAYGVHDAREVLVLSDHQGSVAAVLPFDEFRRLKRLAGEDVS